jgi:hypothetical protein
MKNILQNDEAPRDLALSEDRAIPGEWLVEYFDDDGADYVTIFTGQEAEARARDYRDAGGSERALRMPRWRRLNRGK